ncbi:LysM peptidoglycan-binding domain-containing protein [Pseudoduganella sp. R-34]|uniref:LysM peptidoglycan-binding domain-containing protein n=1 Tax=Pseudoduganella sp. R-34 TaxID=3404062 RepID=UPI003CFA2C52
MTKQSQFGGFAQLRRAIDEDGRVTSYTYDDFGRETSQTSVSGKNIRRAYDEAGHLVEILDLATGVRTTYGYDIMGQRVKEETTGVVDFESATHNRMLAYRFDELGRMTYWKDSVTGLEETISYDEVGNQVRVQGNGGGTSVDHGTDFDGAGRVIALRNSNAVVGHYTYDAAGRRSTYTAGGVVTTYTYDDHNRPATALSVKQPDAYAVSESDLRFTDHEDDMGNPVYTSVTVREALQAIAIVQYRDANRWAKIAQDNGIVDFDADAFATLSGRTLQLSRDEELIWQYDVAGNNTLFIEKRDGVTWSTATKTYDQSNGNLTSNTNTLKKLDFDPNALPITGHLFDLRRMSAAEAIHKGYSPAGWVKTESESQELSQQYNAAGKVSKTTMRTVTPKSTKTYQYTYDYYGDGRERSIRAFGDASGNATFTYNANDKLVMMNQGRGDGQDRDEISRYVYDNDDHIVAKWHDNGKDGARDRIDYVYAQGNPVAETGTAIQGGAYTAIDTKNYALFENYGKDFPGGTTSSYTVKGGETLQGIANTLWGNPSQWYVLAEANGLSGTEELKAGQVLVVPSNGKSEPITSQTHKTYNENEIVGSKLPNLKSPPPKGKKCGGFLQILVIIVAIVVTIYTAGAAAGLMGASLSATASATTFSAGLAVLGGAGGMAGLGAAMIGGAIGSIVSQGVGMAVGIQEHFSWKSVAMSAIGSGVAAGIGGTGVFNLTPSTAINTGLTAMASNVATQGISIAFGQQKNFNWRSVAASGVAAAASSAVGDLLKNVDIAGSDAANEFLRKTAKSVTSSVTTQLVETGKVDWRSVAITEVGNYINSKVNEKWSTGLSNVLAESVVGAGLARLRHQDPLAGAIGGAVGSIVGQMSRSAFAAVGINAEEVTAEGQFASSRGVVNADGKIAGTDIKLPWEVAGPDGQRLDSNNLHNSIFTGQGFSSSNILENIVTAVGSGLGSAFAQWAGRDTRAAASAGGGAASRAYQTDIKEGTAAAFDKLVAADKAKKDAATQAAKPAKPTVYNNKAALYGPTQEELELGQLGLAGLPGYMKPGAGLNGVPAADVVTPGVDQQAPQGPDAEGTPQAAAQEVDKSKMGDDALKKALSLRKEHPNWTPAQVAEAANAWGREVLKREDDLFTVHKVERGDTALGLAGEAYGKENTRAGYALDTVLNGARGKQAWELKEGKDTLMMARDVAESLFSDEDTRKQFSRYAGQMIAGESAIRIQAQILAEEKRQRDLNATKTQQVQQAAPAQQAQSQAPVAQPRAEIRADYSAADATAVEHNAAVNGALREQDNATNFGSYLYYGLKAKVVDAAYTVKGTAQTAYADGAQKVEVAKRYVGDTATLAAANYVDVASKVVHAGETAVAAWNGEKAERRGSAMLDQFVDTLLVKSGNDRSVLLTNAAPQILEAGLTKVQEGLDYSIKSSTRAALDVTRAIDAVIGSDLSSSMKQVADYAEKSKSPVADLMQNLSDARDAGVKQLYTWADQAGDKSPLLGTAIYTLAKVTDVASDATIGSARLAVDGDYRHEKVEQFEKLEAVQSTTHLFVQGVRTAVNNAASGAMVLAGGVVAATGNTEMADNIFGAATDLRNDERFQPIRQDSYAKGVHMAGSIAVTVATIPTGIGGIGFGALQSVNSASTKIEHGASTESALASVGIDLAAIAIGGGLNATAAGRMARQGAPLGGAIGRAEQAIGRLMEGEGRLASSLNALSGDKVQALAGLGVDVAAMGAKDELTANDVAASAGFNALGTILAGRRGLHVPEGPAPRTAHADAAPDVYVGRSQSAEADIPVGSAPRIEPTMPSRVSSDDLLSALPQRQLIERQAGIAGRREAVAVQESVKLSGSSSESLPRVAEHGASVNNMAKHEAEIVRRTTAETVNAEMEAAGMQPAWMKGTEVVERIDPAGTQYRQVVSQGQADALQRGVPAAGKWATRDPIPSQEFARNDLAILKQFKDDVSIEMTYESTQPHHVRDGVVGPLERAPGGAGQVQFLGEKNFKVLSSRELPVHSPVEPPRSGAGNREMDLLAQGHGDDTFVGPRKTAFTEDEIAYYRKKSPNDAGRDYVNTGTGPKVDPVYGYPVTRFQADHIIAFDSIIRRPGLSELPPAQVLEVINLKENLMGLGASTNTSKQDKTWGEWPGHSRLGPVPDDVRSAMLAREAAASTAIDDAISSRLAAYRGTVGPDLTAQAGGRPGTHFERTEGLGSHASIADLRASGALPGTEGVIVTDRTVRFGDIYELGTLGGRKVEFSLTTERVDGKLVKKLYSGDAWTSAVPRDSRLIGHVHPNETPTQQWPSTQDMNTVNARYFREVEVEPTARPTPSRIFWGPGDTDNTIFYPGYGKDPHSGKGG